MFRLLNSLMKREGIQQSRRVRPRRTRLGLETLEDRRVPAMFIVSSTSLVPTQMGTLPYAVAHAQNGDVIDIETSSPIVLMQGEEYLSHNVTIEATGKQAVISGDHLSRVFEIAPGAQVQFINLEVTAGNGVGHNPLGAANVNGDGGGILNEGKLSLTSCLVTGNLAIYGGGINNMNAMTLTSCIVSANIAAMFGGGINNYGTLTINDCTLLSNTATFNGGGINMEDGTASLNSDELLKNSAEYGGGMCNFQGAVAMAGCVVFENSASIAGGGIYNEYGTTKGPLTLTNCTISLNTGDGIYDEGSDPLAIGHCTFIGNTPHSVVGAYVNLGGNTGI